jgi:DNA-binding transcriptional LysR family regulator
MNIKQLETFVQVVEKGSFAAAAEALHTTQSTVSARVKDLEHYFGVELFDRSAHRAQLTAKGRELFDMSRQVVGALEQLRERIGDRHSLTGTLRLGVVGVIAGTWLPALVRELRVQYPSLKLTIEVALSKVLAHKVRGGELDAAIVAGRSDDDELRTELLGEVRFAWMASPSLEVAADVLQPRDIAGYPVIAFSQDSHHHAVTKAWFKAGGVRFQPAITCNGMEVIARLVAQGLGVGLLPVDYYGAELSLGKLQALQVEPPIAAAEFSLLSPAEQQTAFASAVSAAVQAVLRAGRIT